MHPKLINGKVWVPEPVFGAYRQLPENDPKYMENVTAATKIILEDMPAIVLAAELHVIPGNYTYWKGFPNSDDPYAAPFPCWRDIFLMTMKLQPAAQ